MTNNTDKKLIQQIQQIYWKRQEEIKGFNNNCINLEQQTDMQINKESKLEFFKKGKQQRKEQTPK